MTIRFKHFDILTGNWTVDESPNPKYEDLIFSEELDNTLLEVYFPQGEFSFGELPSEIINPDDLDSIDNLAQLAANNHPQGHKLLLSSKSRFLFGSVDCLETIEKLCPDPKDRGAYGSIFLGSCENAINKTVNILIIDDENGNNNGVISNNEAWRLVGDCHGKISPQLAQELSQTTHNVLQFRLGIPEDFTFAKGTLTPKDLSSLSQQAGQPIDLIVPKSSFKGAGKETVLPGLYRKTIWLGEKDRSKQGEIAISQVIPSYPEATRDFLPKLEEHLVQLQEILADPRQLTDYYCQRYESRQEIQQKSSQSELNNNPQNSNQSELDNNPQKSNQSELNNNPQNSNQSELDNNPQNSNQSELDNNPPTPEEDFIYQLIKTDPHLQLAETKYFADKIQDFVRREWLNAAIGKIFTFDRGMIIPSKDLETGKICVPWYPEGESVLSFRSPFIHTNAMIESVNQYVDDAYTPDGQFLQGVIVVNDEDHGRIRQRLTQVCQQQITHLKSQNPKFDGEAYQRLLEAEKSDINEIIDLLNELGATIDQRHPRETDAERQGYDFDGDCIGVALATTYPNLARNARERNLPENAFIPVKKEAKASFPQDWGFEKIALYMADGMSVGIINNQVTATLALQSELTLYQRYGTPELQQAYAQQLIQGSQGAINAENKPLNPIYGDKLRQIAEYEGQTLTLQAVNSIFQTADSLYRDIVQFGAYQNQIAVDLFKSSRRPDVATVKDNNRYLPRLPRYIRQKKDWAIYRHRPLEAPGYSPTELFIHLTNQAYQETAWEIRPMEQFRDLFEESYSETQYNHTLTVKHEFDRRFNQASELNEKRKIESGPILKLKTQTGQEFEVTNLTQFDSFSRYPLPANQSLTFQQLHLVTNDHYATRHHHQLKAQITVTDDKNKPQTITLGTVCEIDRQKLDLRPNTTLKQVQGQLSSPLGEGTIQVQFQRAYDYVQQWRDNLPEGDRQQYAAAAWHLCTTPDSRSVDAYKVSNFVFAAFKREILQQLQEFRFKDYLVGELNQYNEIPQNLWENLGQNQEAVSLQVRSEGGKRFWYLQNPENSEQFYKFGSSSHKSAQLPIGTQVKGKIYGDLFTTATLTLDHPNLQIDTPIVFGNMAKYPLAGYEFRGESVAVTLRHTTPLPVPVIQCNGKPLGKLDGKSVELLKQYGRFQEGQSFEVTLHTLGKGNGIHTLATTPNGNTLVIRNQYHIGHPSLKEKRFNGEATTLTLTLQAEKKAIMAVEIPHPEDGNPTLIGHFGTHPTQKASIRALQEAGLYRDGMTFQAKIASNITAARIYIDPDTLEYPVQWQRLSDSLADSQVETERMKDEDKNMNTSSLLSLNTNSLLSSREIHASAFTSHSSLNPTASHFIDTLKRQPTLVYRFTQDWQLHTGEIQSLPTLGISVDAEIVLSVQKFLDRENIPYNLLTPTDSAIKLETQKGYGVFWLIEGDISQSQREKLSEIAPHHQIYEADFNHRRQSPYHQRLREIVPFLPLRSAILSHSLTNLNPNVSPENPYPIRYLPTLLSTEDYEWQLNHGKFQEIPSLRLSIDPSKLSLTQQWLDCQQIPYEVATKPGDLAAESPLGYQLIRLKLHELDSERKQTLESFFTARLGIPLNANWQGNYYQRLQAIAISEPQFLSNPSNTQTKAVINDKSESQSLSNPSNTQAEVVINEKSEPQSLSNPSNTQTKAVINEKSEPQSLSNSPNTQNEAVIKENSEPQSLSNLSNTQTKAVIKEKEGKKTSLSPITAIIPMNYDLQWSAFDAKNPHPVTTTINAHLGYGRTHTTRKYDPYKYWDEAGKVHTLQPGDIAIAQGGTKDNNRQVAFRVGQKYPITEAMVNDPQYQQQWSAKELHHPQLLVQLWQEQKDKWQQENRSGNPVLWGLEMEILGEYVNNTILILADTSLNHQPQNLLTVDSGIIVQQVNCQGVMGKGLAKSICEHPQWQNSDGRSTIKTAYLQKFQREGWQLGEVQFVQANPNNPNLIVANVAGQFYYGEQQRQTDFNALKTGLEQVQKYANQHQLQVYLPFGLGSGYGGGSTEVEKAETWQKVQQIVKEICPDAVICHLQPQTLPPHLRTPSLASPVNIVSDSDDSLGAALTNPTELAKFKGKINHSYPVSFGHNPLRLANNQLKAEKYFSDKPLGVPFVSAEDAYQHFKTQVTPTQRTQLMTTILVAKLIQHPKLTEAIEQRGGISWLETCSHRTHANNTRWEGTGRQSQFLSCLMAAYQEVITQRQDLLNKPADAVELIPITDNAKVEANRQKDRNMANIATQFIGKSAASMKTFSSTRDYEQGWGKYDLANTGNYSPYDIIMVSGSGPWRGVTNTQIKETFQGHYQPLLDTAIEKGSHFVVGYAEGTDQLVQDYLKERGYQLINTGKGYVTASPQALPPIIAEMIGYSLNNDQQLELPLATYPEKNPLSGLDSRLISLDSIPLDPEFQAENIMKQQEYTQKVAPIARALLHAHQTQEYIGDKTIVRFDGQHLSIQDKCNQQYKMIAEYQGFDGETKQTLWKSIDLPLGSPGLSEGEVKQWTSVQTIQYIKGKMTANQSVSSSQPALVR